MARFFSYRSDIPAPFALAVIRVIQKKQVEASLDVLRGYAEALVWVQAILDDNECQEPMNDVAWWKVKILCN